MTKSELRTLYKSKRKDLSEEQIASLSVNIANQALGLPIWDSSYYHLFLSIQSQNEVDTEYLLHVLQGKDKHVVISKSNFDSLEMTHYLLTDSTKINVNAWQIPEPVDGIDVDPKKIDVVFVPLLAFDKRGHRVGYGKGFYDTFLSQCRPETIKIGVSFFAAEDTIDNVRLEDITLDYCLTPHQVYAFV